MTFVTNSTKKAVAHFLTKSHSFMKFPDKLETLSYWLLEWHIEFQSTEQQRGIFFMKVEISPHIYITFEKVV